MYKIITLKANAKKIVTKNAFDVISIVKVHTIKWQIYPDQVFYVKDLLPMRVTISFTILMVNVYGYAYWLLYVPSS